MINLNKIEQLRILKRHLLDEVEQKLEGNDKIADKEKLYRFKLVEETLNEFIERVKNEISI